MPMHMAFVSQRLYDCGVLSIFNGNVSVYTMCILTARET
jgi:hypothetical protein